LKKYNYIIIGAGCAGLSLLMRMIASGRFSDKKILLIDKSPKLINDRTWCFWEKGDGFFEPIVHHQWRHTSIYNNQFYRNFDIDPYRYKMIRGIDFYQYCFERMAQCHYIEVRYGHITNMHGENGTMALTINGVTEYFEDATVFNSLWQEEVIKQQQPIYLLQHFKGWIIEVPMPSFNTGEAVLMDFRVNQTHGTTFAYVLPLSNTRALVEYTVFSERVLDDEAYGVALKQYIEQQLKLTTYSIVSEEYGVIPMTNAVFPWYDNGAFHIGTAGGQTKASSGYTFQFIQKQTAAIVDSLINNTLSKTARPLPSPRRFHFYDSVLLRILVNRQMGGDIIFTRLFEKNAAQAVFKFLDNETSFMEEWAIIKSLPTGVFLRAALAQLVTRRKR
jgi:lycopene beta-cyclase